MNRKFTIMGVTAGILLCFSSQLISFTGGPPAGRSGAPGESTCQVSCHNSFDLNSGSGTTLIDSDVPATGYMPGETYTLTFKVKESGFSKFGFEGMVYSASTSGSIGNLVITDTDNTQSVSGAGRDYVVHTDIGTAGVDSLLWTVNWEAPTAGSGDVTVYAAFNSASGTNGNKDDFIYTNDLTISEDLTTSILSNDWTPDFRWYQEADQLFVNVVMKSAGDISMSLRDLQGKEVWREDAFVSQDEYRTQVNTQALAAGIYVATIKAPAQVYSRKIVLK
ncbi:MAG: choice-of-anchor V domain-containing protein [Bacteroidota bacterium]